jgi:outer membrane protein OmpA-like peptidoglycan-associated protein
MPYYPSSFSVPPRTPGPLGRNDAADPSAKHHRGPTPGSLGKNDHAFASAFARKTGHLHHHHPPPAHLTAKPEPNKAMREALARFRDGEKGESRANLIVAKDGTPLQVEYREGIVAQIYFATDKSQLDLGDKLVLTQVYNYYAGLLFKEQLIRYPVTFRFVGYADFRGTEEHNSGLSERRAKAVAAYFEIFNESVNYSQSIVPMGESELPQPLSPGPISVSKQLSPFRRVDLFANPILSKVPPPKKVVVPPDRASTHWALRLRAAGGLTKTMEDIEKKLLKKLEIDVVKQIIKHIPALGIGYNSVIFEVVDVTNREGMIFLFHGFSLAIGWDLSVGGGASEWQYAETTKPIHIEDFAGDARHTGVSVMVYKGYSIDWLQCFGPMNRGAKSVYLGWHGWGKGWAASADTEIAGWFKMLLGPYPLPPDYLPDTTEN